MTEYINTHQYIKDNEEKESNENERVIAEKQMMDRRRALFIGDEYKYYYRDKFNRIELEKKDIGFHIPAFFLGFIWLFYRKMYGFGLTIIGLIILIEIINLYFLKLPSFSGLIVSFFLAIKANGLYKQFVTNKIQKIENEYQEDKLIDQAIQKKGGVNTTIVTIIVIVFIALVILTLI